MSTDYFHAKQIRQEEEGDGEEGTEQGGHGGDHHCNYFIFK